MPRLFFRFTSLILLGAIASGCATIKPTQPAKPTAVKNSEERIQQMQQLNTWTINGKIAFLQKNDRESASLFWKKSENKQTLNLTTYLGISVLSVKSNQYNHTITVDGKSYTGTNLDVLIYSLTQISLPAEALSFWLKGLPFHEDDTIQYHHETKLPVRLISQYDYRQWQVDYGKYQAVSYQDSVFMLPTKITITQDDLTIRLAITKWIL